MGERYFTGSGREVTEYIAGLEATIDKLKGDIEELKAEKANLEKKVESKRKTPS